MNGTWKEQLGGYDSKGTRRKRQARKHILKDKIKALEKTFWRESSSEIVEEKNKYSSDVDIFKIQVKRFIEDVRPYYGEYVESVYSTSIREAYFLLGWRDAYTDKLIENCQEVKTLSFLYSKHLVFDEYLEQKPRRVRPSKWKTNILFVYGKAIPFKYTRDYYVVPTSLKKGLAKIVNGKDRMRVKDYIHNADWDANIGTHSLSKDYHFYAWLMY